MASDRELGRRLLEGVAERVSIVLLHGEQALAAGGRPTDLDCAVVPERRTDTIRALREVGRELDLSIVSVWPYDTCGLTLFLMTTDLTRSVQFDLLADAAGLGKYGVRTPPLVATARPGGGPWLRPAAIDEALYLLSKRTLKAQPDRTSAAVAELRPMPDVPRRAAELLAPHARARVARAAGFASPSAAERVVSVAARAAAEAERRGRRLQRPVGAWLHLVVPQDAPPTSDAALGLAADTIAPPLRWVGAAPTQPAALAGLRRSALSHGAVVTCGHGPARWATDNLPVEGAPHRARQRLVEVLTERAEQRLRAFGG